MLTLKTPSDILETERLKLMSITPAHITELIREYSQAEVEDFFGMDSNGYTHYQQMVQGGMETHRISIFLFLLIRKSDGKTIGDCGFHTWNRTHRRAELFYNIQQEKNKNQGYMKEALPLVLKYGFDHLNLHRIEGMVANWNTPSVKLLQNNGFTFEGTMRQDYLYNGVQEDSDCYSLLKHEFNFNY